MIPLLEHTYDELVDVVLQLGQKKFRAKQLADWVYRKSVTDPAAMTNLSPDFVGKFSILTSSVADRADSADGTVKLLIQFPDGQRTECVMIPDGNRVTACVSTQVGCGMGCVFCASGLGGLARDLTGGEILEQVLHLQQAAERRITHVVFMGMGEPLANYDATVWAVHSLVDPDRFGLSARHVTVSTIGLPRPIRQLAAEDLPITLAISLHAPSDALRQQLMPASSRTSIADVLDAAMDFYRARKREVTLEYVLLAGINDGTVHAEALAKLVRPLRCNVNLIPFNPVEGLDYQPSGKVTVKAFAKRLADRGVNVNVRASRGADIVAACGQLRRRAGDDAPTA
ncbi:MAG: dual-specificity RNA methyltransferase RlmN [Planctomycetota bacterium]